MGNTFLYLILSILLLATANAVPDDGNPLIRQKREGEPATEAPATSPDIHNTPCPTIDQVNDLKLKLNYSLQDNLNLIIERRALQLANNRTQFEKYECERNMEDSIDEYEARLSVASMSADIADLEQESCYRTLTKGLDLLVKARQVECVGIRGQLAAYKKQEETRRDGEIRNKKAQGMNQGVQGHGRNKNKQNGNVKPQFAELEYPATMNSRKKKKHD